MEQIKGILKFCLPYCLLFRRIVLFSFSNRIFSHFACRPELRSVLVTCALASWTGVEFCLPDTHMHTDTRTHVRWHGVQSLRNADWSLPLPAFVCLLLPLCSVVAVSRLFFVFAPNCKTCCLWRNLFAFLLFTHSVAAVMRFFFSFSLCYRLSLSLSLLVAYF